MRLCIVGYGTTAHGHARIVQAEGCTVDSVVGRLADQTQEFARELGGAFATTSLDDALARPGLDAVVICSPSSAHEGQTEQALLADKHVLCEIPLAMSYAGARKLADLARERRKVVMVAHTHRYQPAIRMAKGRIDEGSLTLHNVVARYAFLRRENVDWTGRRRSWTDNLLWHHGCHATDMCLWLLGVDTPGGVSVQGNVAPADARMGIPMDLSISMRTPSGQLASVNMSYNSHISLYDYLLIGEQDTLLVSDGRLLDKNGVLYEPPHRRAYDDSAAVLQDREFLAAIAEGRQPAISADSVLPAMWALQQVEGSIRTPAG